MCVRKHWASRPLDCLDRAVACAKRAGTTFRRSGTESHSTGELGLMLEGLELEHATRRKRFRLPVAA